MSDTLDEQTFAQYAKTLDLVRELDDEGHEPTLSFRQRSPSNLAVPELHTLPRLDIATADDDDDQPRLVIVDVLGEGGMGLVRLARQVALNRDVAVKTVRPNRGEAAATALLQEAYVTGFLEHPNIIPIYNVGRGDDSQPVIVMKRVEGTSWRQRLLEDRFPPSDLEREIKVLIQVTNAVRFAHSRHIIHRDIKPENVMIGDFDEVYLLDWGIAVSLGDENPLLPVVDDEDSFVGTPGYMPPEMALQETDSYDERIDVYLLGATLHELLTGQPRHDGETVFDTLYAAHTSEPYDYGDDVPGELAAITNRACHRDPDQRFRSATAFRDALQNFLLHRESVAISASADEKRHQLHLLLSEDDPDDGAIHDTYGECRFGYDQALRIWPDNSDASRGLQQCLESMVRYHLNRENPEAARACLSDLPEPAPELSDGIDELERRLADDQQDLERLKEMERDLDLTTSSARRSLLMVIFGAIFTFTSLYGALTHGGEQVTDAEHLRSHMFSGFRNLAIAVVGIGLFRKPIFANAANARLAYLYLTFVATLACLRWSTWHLGAEIQMSRMGENALATLLLVAIGLSSDLRICLLAILYVVLGVATLALPDYYPYTRPAAVALTFFGFAWLWSPRQMENKITL